MKKQTCNCLNCGTVSESDKIFIDAINDDKDTISYYEFKCKNCGLTWDNIIVSP